MTSREVSVSSSSIRQSSIFFLIPPFLHLFAFSLLFPYIHSFTPIVSCFFSLTLIDSPIPTSHSLLHSPSLIHLLLFLSKFHIYSPFYKESPQSYVVFIFQTILAKQPRVPYSVCCSLVSPSTARWDQWRLPELILTCFFLSTNRIFVFM